MWWEELESRSILERMAPVYAPVYELGCLQMRIVHIDTREDPFLFSMAMDNQRAVHL
jgi:hypothetical protein